jgi:hypothetical protein
MEHQLKVLAGSRDAFYVALIQGALGIHQIFVQVE